MIRRRLALPVTVVALLGAAAAPSGAEAARSCPSVKDPYPDSRYEGVPLSKIRATGVSCSTARKVARGAHYKALGMTPSGSPTRRFSWKGWKVVGELTGPSDRYTATRNGDVVRWRF